MPSRIPLPILLAVSLSYSFDRPSINTHDSIDHKSTPTKLYPACFAAYSTPSSSQSPPPVEPAPYWVFPYVFELALDDESVLPEP